MAGADIPAYFWCYETPHVKPALANSILDGYAMFAACHFVSQILETGYNLVISSACVMILGVRQDFVNEQTQF